MLYLAPYFLYNRKSLKAFTLVELSIVIVIIGLIVAGVTAGQSLVKQSQLQSVMSDMRKYQVSVNTFKIQYNGWPGDINNASSFWPTCDATPSNCNGNGNRLISLTGSASANEAYRVWQQLAVAGLIPGTYTGLGSGTGNGALLGTSIPQGSFQKGGFNIISWNTPTDFNYTGGTLATVNYISYGSFNSVNNYYATEIYTPAEAYNIDRKMDDGLPGKGKAIGNNWLTCATSQTPATATYSLSTTTKTCGIFYQL